MADSTRLNFYIENPFVAENKFLEQAPLQAPLPTFEEAKPKLPAPFWDNHQSTIDCYWKVWELAFQNLRQPTPKNGFVKNYIDTAFNDCLFMWDSAFILLFARYGSRAFNFQQTLDNFYAKQHPDGFICREIAESNGQDRFERFDPVSTGPNVMPWTEWEYYLNFGDKERLAAVFPPLMAYHKWLKEHRTWRNGAYWTSGLGCGMDNQPRTESHYSFGLSHGHQIWIDACLQQILSAQLLQQMARELHRWHDTDWLADEETQLAQFVNKHLWDEETSFYYDCWRDGRLSGVKTIGAYWALLAGLVPMSRLSNFLAHLDRPADFNRLHRVPSLTAAHPDYRADGDYWRGGVWPPTNYMVLRGLNQVGQPELAHKIAHNHLKNVVQVFEQTGTLWENYAPERIAPGKPSKPDFVGWSGLPPVAVLFEYLFGLRADVPQHKLIWDIRLTEAHGIQRYPFGPNGLLDLKCEARVSVNDRPTVTITTNMPLTVELRWQKGVEHMNVGSAT